MARRAKQSGLEVSLFPFLAVLVCAMGSLIFLLLIITRSVHPKFQTPEPPVAFAEVEPEETFAPEFRELIAEPDVDMTLQPTTAAADIGSARFRELQALPQTHITSDAPQYQAAIHGDLQTRLRIQRQREREQSFSDQLSKQQQRNNALVKAVKDARQSSQMLDVQLKELADKLKRIQNSLNTESQTEASLKHQIVQQKTKLDDLRQTIANSPKPAEKIDERFEIVVLDPQRGESREPIFLQCRAGKMIMQPGLLEIETKNLIDYAPKGHPLALTIQEHWRRVHHGSQPPYVLLVVPPSAIEEFYIAGQLLAANNIQFGYELVTEKQEFYYGKQNEALAQQMQSGYATAAAARPRVGTQEEIVHVPSRGQLRSQNQSNILDSIEQGLAERGKPSRPSGNAGFAGSPRSQPAGQGMPPGEPSEFKERYGKPVPITPPAPAFPSQTDLAQNRMTPRQQNAASSANQQSQASSAPPPVPSFSPASSGSPSSRGGAPLMPTIGIEKQLRITVKLTDIQIGMNPENRITNLNQEYLASQFSAAVQREIDTWPEPPSGMKWIPALTIRVLPGGNQTAIRLESIVDQWQLTKKMDYEMGLQAENFTESLLR